MYIMVEKYNSDKKIYTEFDNIIIRTKIKGYLTKFTSQSVIYNELLIVLINILIESSTTTTFKGINTTSSLSALHVFENNKQFITNYEPLRKKIECYEKNGI